MGWGGKKENESASARWGGRERGRETAKSDREGKIETKENRTWCGDRKREGKRGER